MDRVEKDSSKKQMSRREEEKKILLPEIRRCFMDSSKGGEGKVMAPREGGREAKAKEAKKGRTILCLLKLKG